MDPFIVKMFVDRRDWEGVYWYVAFHSLGEVVRAWAEMLKERGELPARVETTWKRQPLHFILSHYNYDAPLMYKAVLKTDEGPVNVGHVAFTLSQWKNRMRIVVATVQGSKSAGKERVGGLKRKLPNLFREWRRSGFEVLMANPERNYHIRKGEQNFAHLVLDSVEELGQLPKGIFKAQFELAGKVPWLGLKAGKDCGCFSTLYSLIDAEEPLPFGLWAEVADRRLKELGVEVPLGEEGKIRVLKQELGSIREHHPPLEVGRKRGKLAR